jgi:hypothetical protein
LHIEIEFLNTNVNKEQRWGISRQYRKVAVEFIRASNPSVEVAFETATRK